MPLGAALRRSGIDELPQLVNVLRGELSIVGPRPCAAPADFSGGRPTPLLNVKPGMIDCAQIAALNDFRTSEQRFNDAKHYVESWSLLRDIKIILMTFFSMSHMLDEIKRRQDSDWQTALRCLTKMPTPL
jgi:lipopolysaccharide/colanic/teichoic acid biosynthesis glycosyltransferase